LTYNQIKELLEINSKCSTFYDDIKNLFSLSNFGELKSVLERKQEFIDFLEDKIDIQISRTKKEESSPKNTTLYFSLLIETKEMIENTMSLLELYDDSLKNK
jgi:hypothetical protein